jgi:hypothetical protein
MTSAGDGAALAFAPVATVGSNVAVIRCVSSRVVAVSRCTKKSPALAQAAGSGLRLRIAYGKVWAIMQAVKDSVHELQENAAQPLETPPNLFG